MKTSAASHDEDALFQLMAEYDEALAASAPTVQFEQAATSLDPKLAAEWESTKQCLQLVERLRHQGELARALPNSNTSTAAAWMSMPKRIGRFLLERELGRGGLGIVYLAHDPQLGRKVALKIPRFEALWDDDLRDRFLREAEAVARLNHPHLVALYEVGEDGAICYLASEFCAGPTLAQWLSERKPPVSFADAANIVSLLAEAVAHAHSRGVLHRDIKPSNVLLSPASRDGNYARPLVPKLTDFGLAKLLGQDGHDNTRTGTILGTVAYMAPEQVEGRIRDLDARTDVYALGAILYEMLTGTAPYAGRSDVDTLRRLYAGDPPAPRSLRPDVPRDLEAIALMCLAKNPAKRYSTAHGLSVDLQNFLAGQPTMARPLSASERATKWAKRRPAVAGLVAVATISLALLVAGSLWFNQRLANSLQIANAERQRVIEEQATTARLLYASQMRTAQQAWRDGNLGRMRAILETYAHGTPNAGLRHFEWFHLNHLANLPHRVFRGHEGEVYGVAYSPDGRTIVTCGLDGTVRLWDVASGESLAVLRDHDTCVNEVDFSPDGDTFVTSSCDNTIKLWSLKDRKPLATLSGHSQKVASCAFIDDGRILASLSYGVGNDGIREARLWDVATRTMRTDWPPQNEIVQGLAVGRTGNTLVTFRPGEAAVWKRLAGNWALEQRHHYPLSDPNNILSADEQKVFASAGHRLLSIQLPDGVVVSQLAGHTDRVHGVRVSPHGDRLATSSADSAVRIFAYPSGRLEQCLLGHETKAWQVAWAPDGKSLASVGNDGTLRVWDLQRASSPLHLGSATEPTGTVFARDFAFLLDGRHVNAVYNDGRSDVWDVRTGQLVEPEEISGPRLAVSTSMNENGRSSESSPALLPQWDCATLVALPHSGIGPRSGSEIPSCARILVGKSQLVEIINGRIRFWKLDPLTLIDERPLPADQQLQKVFDISNDGTRFCGVAEDGQFKICDFGDGTTILLPQTGNAQAAKFAPIGDRILVCSDTVREYDARTGRYVRDFSWPRPAKASYSADSERIAVVSLLGTIAILDASTGEEMLRLEADNAGDPLFSRDRQSLVVAGAPQTSLYCWPGRDDSATPTSN